MIVIIPETGSSPRMSLSALSYESASYRYGNQWLHSEIVETGIKEAMASGLGKAVLEQTGRLSGEFAESAAGTLSNQAADSFGVPEDSPHSDSGSSEFDGSVSEQLAIP